MKKRGKYIHIVSDGKVMAVGYGDESEVKRQLPELRRLVNKSKRHKR